MLLLPLVVVEGAFFMSPFLAIRAHISVQLPGPMFIQHVSVEGILGRSNVGAPFFPLAFYCRHDENVENI